MKNMYEILGVPPDADRLTHYRDIGVDRLVISLDSAGPEKILPELDKWAGLARAVAGRAPAAAAPANASPPLALTSAMPP